MKAVALFWLAFFGTAIPAAAFPTRVVSCHGGDTCRLQAGQGAIKIKRAEIGIPEVDQPYGIEARSVLCRNICGRDVDVEPHGISYDRVVGLIRVQGIGTSEAMVRVGAAWDSVRYGTDPTIPMLKARARAGRLE